MNRLLNFLRLYVGLFLLEVIFVFIQVFLFDSSIMDIYNIRRAWLGSVLWNFWRVLFFGLPFLILYFLLFKYVGSIKLYKPLLFSSFNLLVYVGLSISMTLVWGKNVPLPPEGMFWVTCVAIFLSPLILGQILYYKKIMGLL